MLQRAGFGCGDLQSDHTMKAIERVHQLPPLPPRPVDGHKGLFGRVLVVGGSEAMIIDADGLNLIAAQKRWPATFKAKAILTPHPGEMKRLAKLIDRSDVPSDDDGRIEIALAASRAFGQILVLKGHRTVVTDGKRVYMNRTGDSTLSKAGAG